VLIDWSMNASNANSVNKKKRNRVVLKAELYRMLHEHHSELKEAVSLAEMSRDKIQRVVSSIKRAIDQS